MATDSNREGSDSLRQEIQRLEREKEELERKNKERQLLEQKLRELRGTVSSLRSGESPVAASTPGGETSAVSREDISGSRREADPALQDSRDDLHSLQDQLFGSPSTPRSSSGRGQGQRAGREKDKEGSSGDSSSGGDSEKEEDVMSERHKQAIRAHRDVLVENMLPDDLFNDLISRKILTTADVSRIKEKNTREAINEELLTVLCRRSDRAFHVFVQSLRKTLQEYLANRVDPPSSASRKKRRKRQKGELNISVDCEGIEPSSPPPPLRRPHHSNTRHQHRQQQQQQQHHQQQQQERRQRSADPETGVCSCREVEEEILRMAKEAYRNIRRRDPTPASFEQFKKELTSTNTIVKDSMEIMHTLKILCRHGDITGICEGSVILTLRCRSVASVRALWEMFTSGTLSALIQRGFVTETLKAKVGVQKVTLRVAVSMSEYLRCLQELGGEEIQCASSSKKLRSQPRRTACENWIPAMRPHYQRLRPLPRRAFQEISHNQSPDIALPSKRGAVSKVTPLCHSRPDVIPSPRSHRCFTAVKT